MKKTFREWRRYQWHRWKNIPLEAQLMIGTTVIVAFGTVFYAGAAIFQYCLMKQSAKEASAQADKLIAASEQMANITKGALDEAKRVNEETANRAERATKATESAAKSMAVQADASNKAASSGEKLAAATETTARIAQESLRPVIGFRTETNIVNDKELRFTIYIQNKGGKASNFVLTYCALADELPNPTHTMAECKALMNAPGRVLPNIDYPIAISLTERVEEIRNRKTYFFLVGRIEYDDLGISRELPQFCLVYREGFQGLSACSDLREPANRNPR